MKGEEATSRPRKIAIVSSSSHQRPSRRHAQCVVNAAEIVVEEVERQRVRVVLKFL
jgi:hypothetical protein